MAGKVRVHALAKELGVKAKDILARLREEGENVRSASSTLEAPVARRLRDYYGSSTTDKSSSIAVEKLAPAGDRKSTAIRHREIAHNRAGDVLSSPKLRMPSTIPFADLAAERRQMRERMRKSAAANPAVSDRAMQELDVRLSRWWGSRLATSGRYRQPPLRMKDDSPDLPIVLRWDAVESLVIAAIAPQSPARFGVTSDGALYVYDVDRSYRIYIPLLSPVLDEVGRLFLQIKSRPDQQFLSLNSGFFTDYSVEGEFRPFAILGSQRVAEIAERCLDARGRELKRPEGSSGAMLVDIGSAQWPPTGVLGMAGYRVGQSGQPQHAREAILQKVIQMTLVAATPSSKAYVAEWGGPRSETRIAKVASCLASFAERARRRKGADMSRAVADWESDLLWLKNAYGYRRPGTH